MPLLLGGTLRAEPRLAHSLACLRFGAGSPGRGALAFAPSLSQAGPSESCCVVCICQDLLVGLLRKRKSSYP